MPGPMDLLGGGGGAGMNWQKGLAMGLGQMGQGGGEQAGGISGGLSRAMQMMGPMMQQKREQEMWEALKKRIALQGMQAGDMGRQALPGVMAGGTGPDPGMIY